MHPTRPVPQVGMAAVVRWLAHDEDAVVTAVEDGGRRLTARTAGGDEREFTLRPTTGQFHAALDGPRLILRP